MGVETKAQSVQELLRVTQRPEFPPPRLVCPEYLPGPSPPDSASSYSCGTTSRSQDEPWKPREEKRQHMGEGATISCFRQVEGVLILEAAGVLGAMSVVRGSNGLILGA